MKSIKKLINLIPLVAELLTIASAELAFSSQSPALSQFKSSNTTKADELICYMQSEDGLILNLAKLCEGKKLIDFLPVKDRLFIENYQSRLMDTSPDIRNVLFPIADKNPQILIKKATEMCSAIDNGVAVQFRQAQAEIIANSDTNSQTTEIVSTGIIDSLARKYYCPEFDY